MRGEFRAGSYLLLGTKENRHSHPGNQADRNSAQCGFRKQLDCDYSDSLVDVHAGFHVGFKSCFRLSVPGWRVLLASFR